jgi:hypothetical protein
MTRLIHLELFTDFFNKIGTSRHLPRATIRSLSVEADMGPLYEYALGFLERNRGCSAGSTPPPKCRSRFCRSPDRYVRPLTRLRAKLRLGLGERRGRQCGESGGN